MDADFKLSGIVEIEKIIKSFANSYKDEKNTEFLRLVYTALKEILLLTPEDEELISSLTFALGETQSQEFEGESEGSIETDEDQVEFGTNVENALSIEEGYSKDDSFVDGKHMFLDGMQNFEPKAKEDLEDWIEKLIEKMYQGKDSIVTNFEDLL